MAPGVIMPGHIAPGIIMSGHIGPGVIMAGKLPCPTAAHGSSANPAAGGVACWATAVGCETATALLTNKTVARRIENRRMNHLLCSEQPPL
jgi:hypothetical protein